jgi:hypothetical protein
VARGGSFERSDAASPPAMGIDIRADGKGFTGTLEVRTPAGESATRRVQADDCTEVVDGLAVVTSIALREDTTTTTTTTPPNTDDSAAPQETPGAAPSAAPTPPAPSHTVTAPADSRLRTVGQWDSQKSVPVSTGELGINRAISLTLSGGAVFGAVPNLIIPRYDLTFSLANFITTPAAQKYLIGSVPQVRVSLFGKTTLRSGGFETALSGFKAGAGSCASFWHDLEGLVVLGCADFSVGMMQVETTDATGAVTQSKSVGLGSAGIELTTRYNFGRHIHASFTLGGEAWMGELTAERPDGSRIFDSRLVSGHASLGLGVNF